jgi:glycosyltransferase involved in cell wall biosynthesis
LTLSEVKQGALVSIVVPVFNARATLVHCIESLLRQTHENIEVIAVNDASTDDSLRILNDLSTRDSRLIIQDVQQNVGVHAARRVGVRKSQGEFIGFADNDDWVAPGMYHHLLTEAQRTGADIVICGADCVSEDGQLLPPKVSFPARCVLDDDLFGRFCRFEFGSGLQWNKLYRAPLIRRYSELKLSRRFGDGPEDYIVNVGCFASAKRVVTVPERHYSHFIHSKNLSNSLTEKRAFLRVFGAYVACLEAFSEEIPERLALIDELYIRQLRFDVYRVNAEPDFSEIANELSDCLSRLAAVRPEAVYSLIHAFDLPRTDTQRSRSFGAAARYFGRSGMSLVSALGRSFVPRPSK